MKRIVLIALVAIIAMASIAAATIQTTPTNVEVNIYSNEPVCYEVVSTGGSEPTGIEYTIYTTSLTETDEILGSVAGHAYASNGTATYAEKIDSSFDGSLYTTTWDFCLKDGTDDANDEDQLGTKYVVQYEVSYPTGDDAGTVIIDTTHTTTTAIPEFPTIALPVAAILGLAFFMQRRKEE